MTIPSPVMDPDSGNCPAGCQVSVKSRTVLITDATLLNCWQHGKQTCREATALLVGPSMTARVRGGAGADSQC